MTTYLIDHAATWVGFQTLGAGDRLIVAPQGALILPETIFDLRGTGAAGVALAGFTWLEGLVVEGGTTLSVSGQLISDSQGAALGLWDGAQGVVTGTVTASQGTGVALMGAGGGLDLAGRISAETGIAVTARGASLAISGEVAGSALGISLGGGDASLQNTGTIRGGIAVLGDGTGAPVTVTVTNGGMMLGALDVDLVQGASRFWLANAGSLVGNLTSGASGDVVTGAGLITGHVSLGAGNDRFAGRLTGDLDMGLGNDTVDARGGAAHVIRDAGGNDLYLVDGDVTIEDLGGRDTVRSWVSLRLASGLEVLELQGVGATMGLGNGLGNTISGNAGDNYLWGAAGRDTLSGGEGQDWLRGGLGDDLLQGGEGDDRMNGDAGRDVLTGGAGADVFVFAFGQTGTDAASADLVTDFSDADVIDISSMDAVQGNGGTNDAFTLVQALTGQAGELAVTTLGGDTLLLMDVNGDGLADAAIRLSGIHALTAADFLL
ncbi:calcium-binding protein [Stagnihabitans tardus]|uniref:Peptidase M10 serralysin C-terminal domain-containing protein n=1 Tax=Stagnihabitans tardus TaxID=2699202 RepID=A0AAE4YBA5_9RHOB|nr:calcium-binding protein [Stagnihabitans tardus]NBZ88779.1 hypothetical protein [Stagnihabitans tardus]